MRPAVDTKIRNLVIFPLCLSLMVLLVSATFLISRLQQSQIDKAIRAHLESVQEIAMSHLENRSLALNGYLEFIKKDPLLQTAWVEKNRDAVLVRADYIFRKILQDQKITHFYFIDNHRRCFLRVHKPEYFGDTIQRGTLDLSQQNSASTSGMELGPLGTLTLRVVHPWWIDQKLTGYLELGVEADNLAPKLKDILGSDLIITVDKSYLDRTKWQEGLETLGRKGNWDQFPNRVVISQTLSQLPPQISKFQQNKVHQKQFPTFRIADSQGHFSGGWVPLIDAEDKVIGDIIVLRDITDQTRALKSVRTILLMASMVGVVLLVVFYLVSGRIERRMGRSHRQLTEEISERRRTQEALQQAHDDMEKRVDERTAELSQVNTRLLQQISECELAESALRESEEKYSTLVEDALTGVYIVKDGRIQFVNRKLADIYGYTPKEMVGMDSLELLHPQDRPKVKRIRQNRIKKKKAPGVYEVRGLKKDGEVIWLLRSNALIQFEGQRAVAGSMIDITPRKIMESQIRASEKEYRILSGKLLSAEENERKKIAREVHDGVGQSLSAIKYSLENCISSMQGRIASADLDRLQKIIPLTQESIEEVRRIIMNLRPSILDDLGVIATISWFCREFSNLYTHISIQKKIACPEEKISAPLKTVIYRILQEALNNAAKHSHADRIEVSLLQADNCIRLEIADNGSGFDMHQHQSLDHSDYGFGMASMRKRTEDTEGRFTLTASPGSGTRILAEWGLPSAKQLDLPGPPIPQTRDQRPNG